MRCYRQTRERDANLSSILNLVLKDYDKRLRPGAKGLSSHLGIYFLVGVWVGRYIGGELAQILYEPSGTWSRRLSPVSVVLSG